MGRTTRQRETVRLLKKGFIIEDDEMVKDLMRHIDEVKRFRRIIFNACLFFIVGIGVAFDFIGFGLIEKTIWIAGHAWAIYSLDKSLSTSDKAIIDKMLGRRLRSGIDMTINHQEDVLMLLNDQRIVTREMHEAIKSAKNSIRSSGITAF